eukprot:Skav226499  [mRNA]  locus=scaffold4305:68235:74722:+ [translate_table: standard]
MNRYGICLQRSTFTHLLQAVSSSIRWYQSLDCLSSAQIFDCNHCDVVCCNVAVHALSKAFAWMVAIKLLSTFPQLLVRPDAVSHNALTDDQWGTVFVLMQEMKLGSIRTTTKWYNHAAHIASAGSGKWAKTLGFCHHAWQVQLPPDVVTVNTCLQHLSFVQEWEWAVVWWKNMEVKTGGDQVTNTILTSTKTWTEGLAFLRELSWNRQTLSRTICTAAIKTLEGSDCWTEALSLLRHEADVTSYSAAAACLKQHLWPKAFHLIRMIGQAGFQNDIVSVNSVLGVLTPRWNLAASVFKSMQTAQLEASQISHCAILHTLAIESGISAGAHLWRNALGSFVALGNAGLQIDTASCNAILGSLEKCGQWRESLILMRKDRELSDEITFNAAICLVCLQLRAKKSHLERPLKQLQAIRQRCPVCLTVNTCTLWSGGAAAQALRALRRAAQLHTERRASVVKPKLDTARTRGRCAGSRAMLGSSQPDPVPCSQPSPHEPHELEAPQSGVAEAAAALAAALASFAGSGASQEVVRRRYRCKAPPPGPASPQSIRPVHYTLKRKPVRKVKSRAEARVALRLLTDHQKACKESSEAFAGTAKAADAALAAVLLA